MLFLPIRCVNKEEKSVRVRRIDHKCKVNSNEFDEEERYL
jgi:hypothetical protein